MNGMHQKEIMNELCLNTHKNNGVRAYKKINFWDVWENKKYLMQCTKEKKKEIMVHNKEEKDDWNVYTMKRKKQNAHAVRK